VVNNLEIVFKKLQAQKVRYLIVGGFAVAAHGYLRTTFDLDLWISLDLQNINCFFKVMAECGYQTHPNIQVQTLGDPIKLQQFIHEKNIIALPFWKADNGLPIDLLLFTPLEFESQYDQKFLNPYKDIQLPYISKKGLIALKKYANRPQDQQDIRELNS
jgi:hypothetical protein